MADIKIAAPHGAISVVVSMKGSKGGNELLAEATDEAQRQAAAGGKEISTAGYGVSRDGDDLTITFALKG